MSAGSYTERFTVRGYEVDTDGRLKPQCLSDYLQEAAGVHAFRLGVSMETLQAAGVTWVLSRLQLALEHMPCAGTSLDVETWPVGVEGLQFRRDFRVTDDGGRLLARAVSHWVVVDLTTRRVGKIPSFIAGIALDNAETVMDVSRSRLPALEKDDESCRFTARLADMDRNRHVNNVRYMDWVLESVPDSVRGNGVPSRLEMAFKAESLRGDTVSARIRPGGQAGADAGRGVLFFHSLVREEDGRELVRASSVWPG